jgi:hypothetical protein
MLQLRIYTLRSAPALDRYATIHWALDVLPRTEVRGFLVPAGCLDGHSRRYRRGLVGSGGSRRAALSHHGFGFTPGFDARH